MTLKKRSFICIERKARRGRGGIIKRKYKKERKEEKILPVRNKRQRNANERNAARTDRVREHSSTNQIPVLTFKVYTWTNGFLLRTEANWSY